MNIIYQRKSPFKTDIISQDQRLQQAGDGSSSNLFSKALLTKDRRLITVAKENMNHAANKIPPSTGYGYGNRVDDLACDEELLPPQPATDDHLLCQEILMPTGPLEHQLHCDEVIMPVEQQMIRRQSSNKQQQPQSIHKQILQKTSLILEGYADKLKEVHRYYVEKQKQMQRQINRLSQKLMYYEKR